MARRDQLLDAVIEIAHAAGREIMRIYDTDFGSRTKSDDTPVTIADLAAHRLISERLERLTPEIPVLTEESATLPFEQRSQWPRYWLVDPLDGTREFIDRNGEFTVNIALIEGHEAVLGVVQIPISGTVYFARRGLGAFKEMPGRPAQPIQVRKLPHGRPLVIVGSRSHAGKSLQGFLGQVGEHTLICVGSALKSCMVAEGKADIYPRLGPTSEWDTAAAQCVVEEAGGQLTDTHMQRLLYNTKPSLLNPHFFVFGDDSLDWSTYLTEE